MALDGWSYYSLITVNNTGTVALTDYQVKVSLTSAFNFTLAQSNGGDIRFVDSDGSTLLTFWIESWGSTAKTAVLWAKIPSIAASSIKTIYMYYGNAGAASVSDISNTFLFGDDFNGTSLDTSKWTAVLEGSTSAIAQLDGAGNLQLAGASGVTSSGNVISTMTFTNGFNIRVRRKFTNALYCGISIGNGILQDDKGTQVNWYNTTQGDGYTIIPISTSSRSIYKTTAAAAQSALSTAYSTWGAVNTYEITDFSYSLVGKLSWLFNGTSKTTATNTVFLSTNKYLALTQGQKTTTGGSSYYDWIVVRQYAAVEPTTTLGAMITVGGITPTTVNSAICMGACF